MKLWLDDMRAAPEGWGRTYTVEQTIKFLMSIDSFPYDEVSLDNDLGAGEPEGYVVAEFIAFAARHRLLAPMKLRAHTQNAVARERMEQAFAEARRWWGVEETDG